MQSVRTRSQWTTFVKADLLKAVKKHTARSGNLLVSLGVILLVIVLGVSVFLVLRQTGFINLASSNNLGERGLSQALLETNAKNQTLELLNSSSVSSNKGKTTDKSPDVSAARKRSLLALIEKDPSAFLKIALPSKLRDRLPSSAKGNVEEAVEVTGVFQMIYQDDFENNKSQLNYFLKTADGKRYQLFLPESIENRDNLGPKVEITVKGYKLDNYIVANSVNSRDLIVRKSPPVPEVAGQPRDKKVAIVLINFSDAKVKPFTKAQARQWMFMDPSSPAAYYKETSYGRWTLTGDVYGWFTLSSAHTDCNYYDWEAEGLAFAKKAGLVEDNYTNIMFVTGISMNCGWGGIAEVGGRLSSINGPYNFNSDGARDFERQRVVIHELGHNYGAHHASGYYCVDGNNKPVAISNNCEGQEYADPFDVMGNEARQFNSYHRGQLRLINGQDTKVVKTSGIYTLRPLGTDVPAKEVIRIPRRSGSDGKIFESYYLEYRQQSGYFDKFNPNAPLLKGITIRLARNYKDNASFPTLLIDTHPSEGDSSTGNRYFLDAPLLVNETFRDPNYGVEVKVLSTTQSEAKVEIKADTSKCYPQPPNIYISPEGQWGKRGEQLTYSVYMSNKDSINCPPAEFTLKLSSAGFTQSQSIPSPIVLPPAGDKEFQIFVTSPNNIPDGSHTLTEILNHNAGSQYNKTTKVNYNLYSN